MKISHGTRIKKIGSHNGYGYATDRMHASLNRLGHEFVQNDSEAQVQIWFDQPHHWKWNEDRLLDSSTPNNRNYFHQYRIGYHPWESTKLKDDWVDRMNLCDEIWTPSPLIAEWYAEDGIKVPIHVYEHGVDHDVWTPKKRTVQDTFTFLHVGGEAVRKEGSRTVSAFYAAFPDRDDIRLVMKQVPAAGWLIPPRQGKVTDIFAKLPLSDLVDLFHGANAFIYPSRGEGFGLTPLQAMATGMPTITIADWAPYRRFLDPNLNIPAKLRASPHETVHPGDMFYAKTDDIVDRMRWVVDNYSTSVDFALEQVPAIQKEYDWDTLTKQTFDGLETRLK